MRLDLALCESGAVDPAAREVVGRDSELATLDEFVASSHTLRALALPGRPGIGKTTLWEATIDAAQQRGLLVLSARPSDAEAQHSFAAYTREELETAFRPKRRGLARA